MVVVTVVAAGVSNVLKVVPLAVVLGAGEAGPVKAEVTEVRHRGILDWYLTKHAIVVGDIDGGKLAGLSEGDGEVARQ